MCGVGAGCPVGGVTYTSAGGKGRAGRTHCISEQHGAGVVESLPGDSYTTLSQLWEL